MMKKRNIFYFTFLVCFLIILSSCEAKKEFINNAEDGKNLKREITFGQFKNEIGQPRFSKKLSLATNANARGITDFEVDTTLVKSLESNYIVYSMNLEPKFEVSDDKFYNLVVYKDYSNEVVKQIVEYSPQNAVFPLNDFEIFSFLQSTSTGVIYSSRSTAEPICTELVIVDRCNCDNHPVSICGGCNLGFTSSTELVIVPCSTGGSEPDPLPDPYYPDETGDTGAGNDGAVSVDPVIPNHNQSTSVPCQELKSMSTKYEFRQNLATLKTQSSGEKEKMKFTYNDSPAYSPEITGNDDGSITLPNVTNQKITGYMHCHLEADEFGHLGVFTPEDMIVFDDIVGFSNQPAVKMSAYLVCKEGTFALKVNDPQKLLNFRNKMANDPVFNKKNYRYFTETIFHNQPKDDQIKLFLKYMADNDVGVDLYESNSTYTAWEKLSLDENEDVKRDDC